MKMEQIECSETSAYKIQTPGNHPEENIQYVRVFTFLSSLTSQQIGAVLCWTLLVTNPSPFLATSDLWVKGDHRSTGNNVACHVSQSLNSEKRR
jgi:hypothetical protein